MKRARSAEPFVPTKRQRTLLAVPLSPGGYIPDPPDTCPKSVAYNPNHSKYETITIVDCLLCHRCQIGKHCETKLAHESGRRRRISRQKNGEPND